MRHTLQRLWHTFPWLLAGLWFLLSTLFLVDLIASGQLPVDFGSYLRAVEAIQRGESPYFTIEQSRAIWQSYHQIEHEFLNGTVSNPAEMLDDNFGPYVYPPTLALLIAQLHIHAFIFVLLLLGAVYGFGWFWVRSTTTNGWWVLLIVGSWDVLSSFLGANVEIGLLGLTLAAAWLLWQQRGLWAAPLIALVVLIKPFYALFFVSLGLLALLSHPSGRFSIFRTLSIAALGVLLLIGIEVYRWGPELQIETLHYLRNIVDYQWFGLPLAEQTPMSIWNRTALQGLLNAGISVEFAQLGALALWGLFLAITIWRAWRIQLTFHVVFALAFMLFYWGRPVGWGLIYLEVVIATVLWPVLVGWQRGALLAGLLALMASHWLALIWSVQGGWLRLLTLQSADFPWETWLVVPLCWGLLVLLLPKLSHQAYTQTSVETLNTNTSVERTQAVS